MWIDERLTTRLIEDAGPSKVNYVSG
jgi:hypothetical protein